ncbi:histone h1 [Niveomyces insectorum RCEF 264]|uniref:Histone H1 n=1 Tax=Niveomyces insectorum RCEF 264 TaxID=1081102 RepID=A0A162MQI3_9HYPO|nr:histone h1 [Niveomyces insectorum RCEF 264]
MPPKKTEGASASKPKASHASYQDMITHAIVSLKDRNGSSRPSLKKFVKANNNLSISDAMFDSLFNKALRSGVEKGIFEQPKGASGGTKLAKKAAVKKEADKVKKPAAKKETKKPAAKSDKPKKTATKKEGDKPKKAAPKKDTKAAPSKKASSDKTKTGRVTKPAAAKKSAAAPKKAAPAKKAAAPKKTAAKKEKSAGAA